MKYFEINPPTQFPKKSNENQSAPCQKSDWKKSMEIKEAEQGKRSRKQAQLRSRCLRMAFHFLLLELGAVKVASCVLKKTVQKWCWMKSR